MPLNLHLKKGALTKTMTRKGMKKRAGKLSIKDLKSMKASKNKLTRKRANFALVARKWKH